MVPTLKECFVNILVITGLMDIGQWLDSTEILPAFVLESGKHRELPKPHMQVCHSPPIVASCRGILVSSVLQKCATGACQYGRLAAELFYAYAKPEILPPGFSLQASLPWPSHIWFSSNPPTDWFHVATFLIPSSKSLLHEVLCCPGRAFPGSTGYLLFPIVVWVDLGWLVSTNGRLFLGGCKYHLPYTTVKCKCRTLPLSWASYRPLWNTVSKSCNNEGTCGYFMKGRNGLSPCCLANSRGLWALKHMGECLLKLLAPWKPMVDPFFQPVTGDMVEILQIQVWQFWVVGQATSGGWIIPQDQRLLGPATLTCVYHIGWNQSKS